MLPTLQSLFDPIVGSVEKALEGFEEENQVIFNRELIRGIYLFGSQVYFCRKHGVLDETYSKLKFQTKDDEILEYLDDSDFDLIIVCDEMVSRNFSEGGLAADLQFKLYFDLPIKTFDGKELEVEFEVSLVNTKYFISFVNYHQPVLLQLICEEKLDERFVIYEEDSMRRWRREFGNYFLRIPRLKYAFIHELNYSMNKSFRFWNSYIESSQTDETSLKKVKKNICHGYRLLRFAHQILIHGSVSDFSETNDFYQQVFVKTQNYTSWKEYEQEYQKFYDDLEEKFESLCNFILDKAESLLVGNSSELAILSFLRESKQITDEFLHISNTDNRSVAVNSLDFLYRGTSSSSRLFSLRVHPFDSLKTTFEFSLDPRIHRSENPLLYFKREDIRQCNGLVVEQMEGTNRAICLPRPQLLDVREFEKRVGSVEQEKINAFLFNSVKYYRCFKKPFGKNVNMFFASDNWVLASPDLDFNDWKDTIYLRRKDTCWRKDFWDCFNDLGMKNPTDRTSTFMFCWNTTRNSIMFVGSIKNETYVENVFEYEETGKNLNWEVIERVASLDLEKCSLLSMKEQNEWMSSLSQTVIELNPEIYEGLLFISLENHSTINYHEYRAFEMKCPVHHHIKILNLTNKNYPSSEVLDSVVIENPPRSLINSDKIDQHLLECAVLSNFDITQTIREINPLFQAPYKTVLEKYERLCLDIDSFYHEQIQQHPLSKISSLSLRLCLNQQKIPQKQLKDLVFRLKTFEESRSDPLLKSHTFFQHFISLLQVQPNQKKARVELQTLIKLIKIYDSSNTLY
ncbi:predicted protein [Naegleria gruberi]|uniref:Predicted protein n=1 Tax=Naegleria gruberi TaxID=5762 RepID=D2VHR9_NAEGR|nr:uncharacterized protein NAEGRDRAFT_68423 [Naegleria gruberi]EFC43642.1 predicted protein [Naegleria gruberi]|eukprot:XP_002676386.1 predicted protein [Naegleria gruberi strain NEG-M]